MRVVLALLFGVWLLHPTLCYAQGVGNSPKPVPLDKNEENTGIEVSEQILKTYVGEYAAEPGMILTVTFEDKHLFGQLSGNTIRRQLVAESPTKFFMNYKEKVRVTFQRDAQDKVAGVVMQDHRRPDLHLRKVK